MKKQITSNLPPRGEFVGRKIEKARTLEGLKSNYPFVVIQGLAGIGKTALAREIGWLIKEGVNANEHDLPSFQSIVWIEDHDGDLTLDETLNTIGDVLGIPDIAQLPLMTKQLQITKQLHENPSLIIIDNFETISDSEIENWVKKIPSPRSRAIITSRKKVLQGEGWIVHLDKVDFADSLAIAQNEANRLGLRMRGESQSVSPTLTRLCKMLEGDPYLIRIKVGQLQAGVPLETVLHTMAADDERLQPSWDILSQDLAAIKTLMAIAVFQSPPAESDVAFVSQVSEADLSRALKQLDNLLLVNRIDIGDRPQYSLHSRTKIFVLQKVNTVQPAGAMIQKRLADWVESYVNQHGGLKNWQGYRMLDQQYTTILEAVTWCSQQTLSLEKQRAISVWRAIDHYMSVKGNMDDYIKLGKEVLECARTLEDSGTTVEVIVGVLGWAYLERGRRKSLTAKNLAKEDLAKAETLIREGLATYRAAGNWEGVGTANRYLGEVYQQRGDHESSRQFFEESLGNFEVTRGLDNLGAVLSSLGILSLQKKDLKAATAYQTRRLALAESLENPQGMAVALYNLGRLAQIEGKETQAKNYYTRALDASYRSSKNDVAAGSQRRLAEILKQQGNLAEAKRTATRAYECYEKMGSVPSEMLDLIADLERVSQLRFSRLRHLTQSTRRAVSTKIGNK